MKILFQCDGYYPNTEASARRITGLAEGLAEMGDDVEILCPFPDYVGGKKRKKWLFSFKKTEWINGVKVNRCFCVPFCNGGTVRRLLYQFSFRLSSRLVKVGKPDIVITSTPPLISCKSSVAIARKFKAKLVVDVRDIWPEVAIEMGFFDEKSFKAKSFSRIAEYLYKNAALITTVSNRKVITLKRRLDKYHKHAVLISNGVDDFFINQSISQPFLEQFRFDDFFSVIHVGKVGNAQDLDSFLELAKRFSQDNRMRFFIIGDGVKLPHILDRIKKENIANVVYCGKRNSSECLTAYRYSKVSYISLVNQNLKDSVPTKLYETLFSGCPCLLSAAGESEDVVRESRFGLCSMPGDIDSLEANLTSMVNNYGALLKNKDFCFNYINSKFNRKQIVQDLRRALLSL